LICLFVQISEIQFELCDMLSTHLQVHELSEPDVIAVISPFDVVASILHHFTSISYGPCNF